MRARIIDIEVSKKKGELDAVIVQARGKTYAAYLDLSQLTRKRFSVNQRITLLFGKRGSNAVYLDGVLAEFIPILARTA